MGKDILKIHKNGLTFGGKPFYLASGDMHYFRFFSGGWERRLRLMKDFGLTAVQTYVPWNMHEPKQGTFCFDGNLDVAEFLRLCQKTGLKVMFRPSVYMCSEWDFGGLPYWLLKQPEMCIRTSDKCFMDAVRLYYERLAEEFVPFLSTNGGPIIAVGVENEYGSFGDDADYIKATGDLLKELGVDVPLYTSNGTEIFKISSATRKEYWTAVDCHELTDENIENNFDYQPDKPVYVAEFWAGRSQQWGGYFKRQTAADVAEKYKSMLDKNAYVNFYMFCGGSNFGFHNGALVGKFGADVPNAPNRYIPFATSYDVDAPVTENGLPTEKYFECRQVLLSHLKKIGANVPEITDESINNSVKSYSVQSVGSVTLSATADLLGQADNLARHIKKSGSPLTMELMDQDFGFILYKTKIPYIDDLKRQLFAGEVHDRATVYGNGEYLGCIMRDKPSEPITFTVPKEGLELEILVENLGRVNFGNAMLGERKGILKFVKIEILQPDGSVYPWNYTVKNCWTNYSLPLDRLDGLKPGAVAANGRPTFFTGEFDAKPGIDTFLSMKGWEKGAVWINGFNIGRYWSIGPQETLYVPGELLKEHNSLVILELHSSGASREVSFVSAASLDIIPEKTGLEISVVG